MQFSADMTLREARDLFYESNSIATDGGVARETWLLLAYRNLHIRLPNFAWRKKALRFHDLHHILTEYRFGPSGEFQIAAWEFAAGKYPNVFSTLFCSPLIAIGFVLNPRKQFRAFVRGLYSNTLYGKYDYEEILEKTLGNVRQEILPSGECVATLRDTYAFTKAVGFAAGVICAFPILGWLIYTWLM